MVPDKVFWCRNCGEINPHEFIGMKPARGVQHEIVPEPKPEVEIPKEEPKKMFGFLHRRKKRRMGDREVVAAPKLERVKMDAVYACRICRCEVRE